MAKRGGPQQLQAHLQSDADFEHFIQRPGLIVIDIYSDWCGPCLSMVNSLKTVKLELGGDDLSLAIAASDSISYFKRFNKKSEPVWFFIVNGKAVNLYFGVQSPRLIKMIATELDQLKGKSNRPTYELWQLQPEEIRRKQQKDDAIAAKRNAEIMEKEKKRRGYLTHCTDTILENMTEMGVSFFGPHVNRDMIKHMMPVAEALKLQLKDRKVAVVKKENFDVVNYACNNPLDEDLIDYLDGKECLLCFWKVDDFKRVVETMSKFATDLTTPKTETIIVDDVEEEHTIPPILEPLTVKIEIDLADDEASEIDSEEEREREKLEEELVSGIEEVEEEVEEEDEFERQGMEEPDQPFGLDFPLDPLTDVAQDEEEEVVEVTEILPQRRFKKKKIVLPPVWVPDNARTHASLIYVFFRHQTTPFLEPDPKPEPPHVIMAYDVRKKRDLLDVASRHKDDIPLFGFFTTDDFDTAEYITRFPEVYNQKTPGPDDKIIFKVHKATSNTMLSMATYGPSYVSPNAIVGKIDSSRFFPESFETDELSPEERQKQGSGKSKEKSATVPEKPKEDVDEHEAEVQIKEEDKAEGEGESADEIEGDEGEEEALEGDGMSEDGAPEEAPPADAPAEETTAEAPPTEEKEEAAPEEAPPAEAPAEAAAPAEAPPAEETAAEAPAAEPAE